MSAPGAPDCSGRQPETAHNLFLCTRSCEKVAQKSRALLYKFVFHAWLHSTMATLTIENSSPIKIAVIKEDDRSSL